MVSICISTMHSPSTNLFFLRIFDQFYFIAYFQGEWIGCPIYEQTYWRMCFSHADLLESALLPEQTNWSVHFSQHRPTGECTSPRADLLESELLPVQTYWRVRFSQHKPTGECASPSIDLLESALIPAQTYWRVPFTQQRPTGV